jgi:subtilisin family serine protease
MVKRTTSIYFLRLLVVLLAALGLTSVATAQQQLPLPLGNGAQPGAQPNAQRIVQPAREGIAFTPAQITSIKDRAIRLADGRIQVIVSLSTAPAVDTFVNSGGRNSMNTAMSAARAQKAAIDSQQAGFASAASGLGASVLRGTWFTVNSVTVAVAPSQLAALAALPGVTHVQPNTIIERDDTVSVPFIEADDVWTGFGGTGYTGDGTVIAVIDSGIDYVHTHFGGSGNYATNPNTTVITDTPGLFPAAQPLTPGGPKVVGGYDFVGDAYDSANPATSTPVPDPDPIDCPIEQGGGHGTHVAGTAAGWGVTDTGTTYAGPYNNIIFTGYPNWTPSFRIGPGVAPEAALLAMRVFGCDGSTSTATVVEAIDAAAAGTYGPVADVINMSLGSPYGTANAADVENVAIASATAAGTIVVTSTGNQGDFFYVAGSPGAANEAIAVASSVDPGNQARGVRNDATSTIYPAAYGASSPFIHAPVTAPMEQPDPNPNGCTPADFAGFTAGNIALIDRGACDFSVKQDNAFAAGAAGVIVANVPSSPNPEELVTMAEASVPGYNIPTVHVALTAGNALRASANGTNTATLDWRFGAFLEEDGDTLSSFSSRGPIGDNPNSIKPDIAAPGNTILSAGSGTGQYTYNIGGTSMAAPHIAGSMAMLREKYPTWPVADLKALIMNTANHNVTLEADNYGPQRIGSGRVDLGDTFNNSVIAYNSVNKAGVSVSFGAFEVPVGSTVNETRTVTVENKGAAAVTYATSFQQGTDATGITMSVSPASIIVPAGGTANVTVTLSGNPNVPGSFTNGDPTLDTADRHRLAEESGWLILTPSTGVPLRLSLYGAPQLVGAMSGTLTGIEGATGTATIDLSGTDVETGVFPTDVGDDLYGIVTTFELAASSPNEAGEVPDKADLAYVGVTSDYSVADPEEGYTYFGIATHGEWATPADVEFDIYVDLDRDGAEDFIFYNSLDSADTRDIFVVAFIDVNDAFGLGAGAALTFGDLVNGVPGDVISTYLFNNNVMVLPVPTEFFTEGLGTGSRFNYWVESYAYRYADPVTDQAFLADSIATAALPLKFNPADPVYDFTGGVAGVPAHLDLDGESIDVGYDFTSMNVDKIPDILLLHHHNSSAAGKAQVLPVDVVAPGDFVLLTPPDGAIVTDPADVTQVTWQESADASSYTFYLFRTSNNPREIGEVLVVSGTAAPGDDAIGCSGGTCFLPIGAAEQAALTDGSYSWTVKADGLTEASNAPFTFKVNTGDIDLLVNGGFEGATVDTKVPDGWEIKNRSGEKRKVDEVGTTDPRAYSGTAYFLFKGRDGENSKLQQNPLENEIGENILLTSGDSLTANVYVNTSLNNPGKLLVKVKYEEPTAGANGDGKDKLNVPFTATTAYQAFGGTLELSGTVRNLKFIVAFDKQSGKMWVDEASLVRGGMEVRATFSDSSVVPLP